MAWASETISSAPDLQATNFHVEAACSTAQVPYRFYLQAAELAVDHQVSALNDDVIVLATAGKNTVAGIEQQGYKKWQEPQALKCKKS